MEESVLVAFENLMALRKPTDVLMRKRPAGALRQLIARINGEPITLRQLVQPLIEARGLPLLLNIVQLDLAHQEARESHVVVTPDDIALYHDRGSGLVELLSTHRLNELIARQATGVGGLYRIK